MKKLIINELTFAFNKQEHPFFHDIHIEFASGNIYFIQGKNGVGKSTFFSILQGTTPRNATLTGTVTFDNNQFIIKNNCIDTHISSHVKTVVQDITQMIVTTMTVEENLRLAHLPTYPRLIPLSHTINIPIIMHDFGIDSLTDVQRLSGGQKQILAIMMALQKPTQILLLDEPTAALDEKNTHMVMQFLTNLTKTLDLIIIIITHDKELTTTYAQNRTVAIKVEAKGIRTITML
jgi:ABC-type lipoprotein export system ATPase subunit